MQVSRVVVFQSGFLGREESNDFSKEADIFLVLQSFNCEIYWDLRYFYNNSEQRNLHIFNFYAGSKEFYFLQQYQGKKTYKTRNSKKHAWQINVFISLPTSQPILRGREVLYHRLQEVRKVSLLFLRKHVL